MLRMINTRVRRLAVFSSLATVALAVTLSSAGYAQVCFEANQAFGVGVGPYSLTSADLDGDGDQDLVSANNSLGSNSVSVLLNQGNGTFAMHVLYAVGLLPASVTSADLDGDGDQDLASANNYSSTVSVLRNCQTSGIPFCAGDGSATACPCGNSSPLGADAGCSSSLGLAATLRGSGSAKLSSDQLVLEGAQMPDSAALYFQGTVMANGGAGSVFGDGLRCAGGTIVRLGIKLNVAGTSQFPAPGARRSRGQRTRRHDDAGSALLSGVVSQRGLVLHAVDFQSVERTRRHVESLTWMDRSTPVDGFVR